MKKQKFFGIILAFCVLLTLAGCATTSTFDGSRVKNADSYQLDIKTMNSTDTHTLELKQGDILKIQFETENGNLSMKITAPDGTELYQGDGTVKEFIVEAPMDGAYPIVVVGQKAKGSIHIDLERVPEAVESEGTQELELEPEPVTLTADDLVGPWHLADDEKDNATAIEAIPSAIEFGSSLGITSDGHISWYIGADVVEIVNLRGDTTTVYKLADGTYMDRIERHFSYNGTDTWTDEDGVEWNEVVK